MSSYYRPPCVTLADHKAVVRSWHGRTTRAAHPSKAGVASARQHNDEFSFPWKPLTERNDGGAYDEESIADTDDQSAELRDDRREDDELDDRQGPGPLRTVGQIKHAYRARAKQEQKSEQHALSMQLERRKRRFNSMRQKSLEKEELTDVPPPQASTPLSAAMDAQDEPPPATAHDDETFMTLDPLLVVTDPRYHIDVLRAVRRELSVGRHVRLRVDGVDEEALGEVKLAVQQLCAESLLFCAHDQTMIPLVDLQQHQVTLELNPRLSCPRSS